MLGCTERRNARKDSGAALSPFAIAAKEGPAD